MSLDLLKHLQNNPFVLAPMAGITDSCFRSVMRELGCGIVITELVSAHGIEYKSPKTLQLMKFEEVQRPVGIQLFGETPEVLAEAAKVVADAGADFVDLNFGCPVPKVVKKGAGSAILKDLDQVERVFRTVKAATPLPLTVKIRTGWDENSRNAAKVAEIAYNEGLTWVAIHGRTRSAGYSGLADWDFISEVKAKSRIPIIGNGDISSAETAVRRLRETGCDGVMIGRGCLKNPWIFREARELWAQGQSAPKARDRDFIKLFHRFHSEFTASTDERITALQIKKFASWYSSGYPGASNFRKAIFQTQSLSETMGMTLNYFTELQPAMQADTSSEAFLMGGHG
ncbi:MAG TPA: tRNA dihydrouridine synthase DusB [Bdellovibrionales bacterium]|nr:tRNA dihydrouridine synthase DusB [Bdellovibrionales bacterium]